MSKCKGETVAFITLVMLLAIGLILVLVTARVANPIDYEIPSGNISTSPFKAPDAEIVQDMRVFRFDRRYMAAVYNYANRTFVNVRETLNHTPTKRGIVFSAKQFMHLRRMIPSIHKAVAELRAHRGLNATSI
jgi:hypothetical protein